MREGDYMRKCIKVLLLSLFISSQFACTNNVVNAKQNTVSSETDTAQETKTNENNKVLVVYFSVMETDGTDTVSGASRVVSFVKLSAVESSLYLQLI